MLRWLMWPANAVCDAMGLKDEGERGMVRILVNTILLTLIFTFIFVAVERTF